MEPNTETTPETTTPPGRTEGDQNPGDESVPYKEFKSVKDDMHRFKEENRKLAEELKSLRDKDMRDKEQWKEFGSAKEQEANEWKSKYDALSKSIMERAKLTAVKEQAMKLGLVESAYEDLELLEMRDVVVETTSTGKVNVIGAKSAAERIKSLKPHWFSDKPKVPTVNNLNPEVRRAQDRATTYQDLAKLEEEAKKTGDYTEYHKRIKELKTQKR